MAWRARLRNGLVQYSAPRPPSPLQASRELLGLDGGDWRTGISTGHPDRPADGGDFAAGTLILTPMPQVVDGGLFSS
jgi:hypothetical protein